MGSQTYEQLTSKVRLADCNGHKSPAPKSKSTGSWSGREERDLSQGLEDEQKLATGWIRLTDYESESHYCGILREPSFISEALSVSGVSAGFSSLGSL